MELTDLPPDLRRRIEASRAGWSKTPAVTPDPKGPGQVSVWDYPRPPALVPDSRRVRIIAAGSVLAETTRAIKVCETASPPCWYLPPDDVRMDRLAPVQGTSVCEWKGFASYVALKQGDRSKGIGWVYRDPFTEFAAIAGYLAFYAVVSGAPGDACYVDDVPVVPQPGGFYGGWITPELTGPFKGVPGSGHW